MIFVIAGLVTLLGAAAVFYLENDPAKIDFGEALAYMAQNVTGVSIGARIPLSRDARVASVFIATIGAALRGVFVATVVSTFVNQFLLEGRGVGELDLKDHVVIAGWNPQVKQLVEVLEREAFGAGVPVALLSQLKENPLPQTAIYYLNGDPVSKPDLQRAAVEEARAVVIVSDLSGGTHSDSTLDARAVLSALAVKSINPRVHLVAEVRDPENRYHFKRASVDELIVTAEMSEGLLARAALSQGLAQTVSYLLRLDTPGEIYVIPTPGHLENTNFPTALADVYQKRNAVLIGVLEDGEVVVSPPKDYLLHQGTLLVLVGNINA